MEGGRLKGDERGKRLFAASEARPAEWGGVAAVDEVLGFARSRIIRGLKDLDGPAVFGLTSWPEALSSHASFSQLWETHVSGRIGSPIIAGPTRRFS
jgi:hypothetical protein